MLVYLVYAGVNWLQSYKIKKLEKEIVGLKSDLYNNQKDLLATISKEYTEQFKAFKKDNDAKMETIVRFNEYTLEKVLTETAWDFSKYRKETQKLLSNTKWIDTGILEDFKLWK